MKEQLCEICPSCKLNTFEVQTEKYAIVKWCSSCGLFRVTYFTCCDNDNIEKVIYYQKDDRKTIRDQCLNCGKLLNTPLTSFSKVNEADLNLFNESLAEQRKDELEEIRVYYSGLIKGNYSRIRYNKFESYYYTGEWKELRQKVFQRDNNKCVRCGDKAEQVHHLTYERFKNELLEDLESVCFQCHSTIHSKE